MRINTGVKIGRPTKFTPALAAEICDRIESGEFLRAICRDESMPSHESVYHWRGVHPSFADALARARKISAGALADKAMAILDELPANVSAAALRIADARARQLWYLAKCFDPATFGNPKKGKKTPCANVGLTVGGILDLVMGRTTPLVTLDAEAIGVSK